MPDALFVIAGEGPARASLRELAAQLGCAQDVQFVGYLDRDTELLDCYAAADAFVFASRTETQGLVLLEAMAQGAPIVSTAKLGTRSILKDRCGALIVPEELDSFAAAVCALARGCAAARQPRPRGPALRTRMVLRLHVAAAGGAVPIRRARDAHGSPLPRPAAGFDRFAVVILRQRDKTPRLWTAPLGARKFCATLAPASRDLSSGAGMSAKRALIVDDSKSARMFLVPDPREIRARRRQRRRTPSWPSSI